MARLKLRIQRPWIPYIIFVVTLTITLLATFYVARVTYNVDHLRFLNAVEATNNDITSRIQTYVALLRGIAGLYAADPNITEQQFNSYINRLRLAKNYPGAQGIGLIQVVSNSDKENYIQSVQNQDSPDFSIKPEGTRSTYYVIRYLTLTSQHTPKILGEDMGIDKFRLQAMEIARDKGTTTASKRLQLWTTNHNTHATGFLLFTPLFKGGVVPDTIQERRANIIGYIYSVFSTNTLLQDIAIDKLLPQVLNYKIYDSDTFSDSDLLYDTSEINQQTPKSFLPRFQSARVITVGGNNWTAIYTNHPQFDLESEKNLSTIIFIGGLLVSLMFFMLSRSQYIARTNAEITTNKLKSSQRDLQRAINHRDNFISIASHELKTPLTSLKVYAEVLLRQFTLKGDEKTTEYLVKINRQIDKLNLLIQDLLDVSRIQTNQMTFREEKFDLNDVAKEVIDNTQQIADHHDIILVGSIKRKIWGDRERIGQVLVNLLTNAIKYSPKAKKIIVTLKETDLHAVILVKDFGIGIDKDHQKKIFDRFYRISDSKGRTFPGLGIGLFISQAIIRRHGGEITLTSQMGEGSIFRFTLPFQKKNFD